MRKIDVIAEHNYEVQVGVNFQSSLIDLAQGRSRVAIIFSEAMRNRVPQFDSGDTEFFYFPIPDGESGKSSTVLQQAWNWLGAAGFTRTDLIVGIGGGAVTDFAGFVAASWLRGLDWVAVPTTVAGMVDAAVGGKTGINSDYGKNLIGAFHSPVSVLIDSQWLETLSDRDFAAGLAEVVKCGFIRDPQILQLVKGKSLSEIRGSSELTLELIERSVTVKATVVSGDFKESFDREILNYGHTLGHAIEHAERYRWRHGAAISIGMIFAAELSRMTRGLSDASVDRHRHVLGELLGLPLTYPAGRWETLLATMRRDKKARGAALRFVLLDEIGRPTVTAVPDESILFAAYGEIAG